MPEKASLHHLVQAQQLSRELLEGELFPEALKVEQTLKEKHFEGSLRNLSLCLYFYQPSTRTRISFEQAASKLGMTYSSTENAREFSSAIKGESLKDTIRVAHALHFDAVVLRYHQEGGAEEAASVSRIPVINAGDGTGQHPTQALLDTYTAFRRFGSLDNLNVTLVGDLKNGRTTHSATYLLSKFKGTHFNFVAPDEFQMKQDILDYLDRHQVGYKQLSSLQPVANSSDIVYLTRIQKEYQEVPIELINEDDVKLNDEVLDQIPRTSVVMHPLPRNESFGELPEKYTNDPRVVIFDQVRNGLYTRVALLKMLLS